MSPWVAKSVVLMSTSKLARKEEGKEEEGGHRQMDRA